VTTQTLRFHAGKQIRKDALTVTANSKEHHICSYAIGTKLSSICNCDDWCKLEITLSQCSCSMTM